MSLLLLLTGERDPRHFELLKIASELRERGQREFAVIAAQMACELYAEVALTELLKARHIGELEEVIPDLLGGYNLMDRRGQRLFHALTGRSIQQADFWTNYKRHVERRNRVVHKGEEPTDDEAAASIAAAGSFFDYVAKAWEGTPAEA
jgi:HEPN domain-containing protein